MEEEGERQTMSRDSAKPSEVLLNHHVEAKVSSLDALTLVVNGQAERGVLLLDVGDQGWVEEEREGPEDDEPVDEALEEHEPGLGLVALNDRDDEVAVQNGDHGQVGDEVESCTEAVRVVVEGLLDELAAVPDCLVRGNALDATQLSRAKCYRDTMLRRR
jgi:hypothetical protein